MKRTLSIAGAVLFTLGFAMATGVDQNPVQAVYAVVCIAAAGVSFRYADRIGKRVANRHKVYNYRKGTLEAA